MDESPSLLSKALEISSAEKKGACESPGFPLFQDLY